jgi:hypothetical protein
MFIYRKKILIGITCIIFLLILTGCSSITTPSIISTEETLEKFEADSAKGFQWPYYLYVPSTIESSHILVITNNTGHTSDDFSVHDQSAQSLVNWKKSLAKYLGCPLLVPVFPRPYNFQEAGYTHALDEVSLTATSTVYHRLDLQLIAMIEDAINRLNEREIDFEETILMWGSSASGMFANRFTALHPERVKAAAIGAPGGWPIVPVAEYEGVELNYPIGIADLFQLVGYSFDVENFKNTPLYLYLGDQDTNDALPYNVTLNTYIGTTPVSRWPIAEEIYNSVDCNCEFVLYPGVGHEITNQMEGDVKFFLSQYR